MINFVLRLVGILPRPRPAPPPLSIEWRRKHITSARTTLRHDDAGRLILTIEHDLIIGVTPEMLDWWFRHIGGAMAWQGAERSRYRVWHPEDHIDWQLVRGDPNAVGAGSQFRIVEAFGRRREFFVDTIDTVEKLDETGIRLVQRRLGETVFSLEHTFEGTEGGTLYRSTLIAGAQRGPLRVIFNRFIRPRLFSDAMGRAWLRHNVEEVGNFESFLPVVFARRSDGPHGVRLPSP